MLSCSNSLDINSIEFGDFLNKLGIERSNGTHLYILLPSFSCHGCIQKSLIELDDILLVSDKPKVTIISQLPDIDLKAFHSKAMILFDKYNFMDSLPFTVANMTIIITVNHRIIELKSINLNDIPYLSEEDFITIIRK